MDRRELLEYVRELRTRQRETDSRSGFNLWALCAAFFALAWKVSPDISAILEESRLQYIVVLFSLIFPLLISFVFLVGFFDFKPSEKYAEYRVSKSYNYSNPFVGFVALFSIVILPLVANHYSSWFSDYVGYFSIVSWVNFCVLSVFVFTYMYSVYVRFSYMSKYGLPPLIDINLGEASRFNRIASGFGVLLLGFMFFSNAIVVFLCFSNNIISVDEFVVSFSIVAMSVVFVMVVSRLGRTSEGARLERLERDIVIAEISNEEIKERLEEEYIGVEFSQLVSGKISKIDSLSEKISNKNNEYESFKEDVLKIDREYEHEINSRVSKFWDEFCSLVEEYNNEVEKLTLWFDKISINLRLQADEPLKEVVDDSVRRVKDRHQRISEITGSMRGKYEALKKSVSKVG